MFWWLVQNTLLAGVLALAAALAGRFGRLSPAVRHALWLVVLAKLVTPPLIFYSLPEGEAWADWLAAGPLFDAPQQTTSAEASPQPAGETAAAERLTLIPAEAANEEPEESVVEILQFPLSELEDSSEIELAETAEALAPILLDDEAAEAPEHSPPTDLQSTVVGARATRAESVALVRMSLAGLWALGAAWMVGLQTVRLVRFRRLLRGANSAPESLTALVAEIAAQIGARAPQVVLTSAACSPMIFAWGRVRLVWPESLAEPFDADSRRAVVAHELAHLRRRDHWVGWLELAASCGWWWNPLFWHVWRQLRETAELACDAWVVELLPGGRRAYAQALVEVSEMISWTAAPAPAVGMGASARHLFERRLAMILRERVPCRAPLVGLALIGLLGIAVLPGWTKGQAPADEAIQANAPGTADDVVVDNLKTTKTPSDSTSVQAGESRPPHGPTDDSAVHDIAPQASTAHSAEAAPASDAYRITRYDRGMTDYERLEARLAELAAELRALRQSDPRNMQAWNPFARSSGGDNQEVRDIDLPELQSRRHVKFALFVGQSVRLRLPDERTIRSVEIRTPEVLKIKQQSPRELVLIAVRQGDGLGKLWDEKQGAYSLHAVVRAQVRDAADDTPQPKGSAAPGNSGDAAARKRTKHSGDVAERPIFITHKLATAGQAAAFAAFIEQNIEDNVVSVKVFGDSLVISATDDDQQRIGQFLQLLRRTPERTEAPEDRRDDGRSSSDAFAPPIAVDAGLPLPAGLPGQAPAATSGPKGAAPLAGSQESALSLSPPESDAAPR